MFRINKRCIKSSWKGKKHEYSGLKFDSKAEMEFYIKCEQLSIRRDCKTTIERIPSHKNPPVAVYTITHEYNPDFMLSYKDFTPKYIEYKGRFEAADRQKLLAVKEQCPDVEILLAFPYDAYISNKNVKNRKRISDWCKKHGFDYCFKQPKEEWFQ